MDYTSEAAFDLLTIYAIVPRRSSRSGLHDNAIFLDEVGYRGRAYLLPRRRATSLTSRRRASFFFDDLDIRAPHLQMQIYDTIGTRDMPFTFNNTDWQGAPPLFLR